MKRPTSARNFHSHGNTARTCAFVLGCGLLTLGCEEAQKPQPIASSVPEVPPEAPRVQSPPILSVDAAGPVVRGMTALLEQQNGSPSSAGLAKLKQYLGEEKKFIEGQDVRVAVDRQAKPHQVATFLSELGALGPSKVTVSTDTRPSFSKELTFVPETQLESPTDCTLIGTITDDRGTAIWRLSGGAARKRGRGMGGPDLSMTGETIKSMSKSCDSDLFFVAAPADVEWGLVYDLAASGIALEEAGLSRAVISTKPQTAGHKVEL